LGHSRLGPRTKKATIWVPDLLPPCTKGPKPATPTPTSDVAVPRWQVDTIAMPTSKNPSRVWSTAHHARPPHAVTRCMHAWGLDLSLCLSAARLHDEVPGSACSTRGSCGRWWLCWRAGRRRLLFGLGNDGLSSSPPTVLLPRALQAVGVVVDGQLPGATWAHPAPPSYSDQECIRPRAPVQAGRGHPDMALIQAHGLQEPRALDVAGMAAASWGSTGAQRMVELSVAAGAHGTLGWTRTADRTPAGSLADI